jgi:integrator complex subunit 12
MLEEAIRHRKGLGPGPVGTPASPTSAKERSSPFDLSVGGARRDAADKRSLDRLKHDLSELAAPGLAVKRPRMDSPRSSSAGFSSKSHTPSPTPPGSRGELEKQSSSGSGGNSSEDAEEMDLDDITLEGLNDCTCCVCKSFNQENGNKLMECQTCQNLYHQECHFPVVSNEEANDPRLVWNCSECSRKNVSRLILHKEIRCYSTLATTFQPSLKQSSKSGSKGLGLTSVSPSPKSARASPSKFTEIASTSNSGFKKA